MKNGRTKKVSDSLLIIFIRNPLRGEVKKRLIPHLGEEEAFRVYQKLLLHTRKVAYQINTDKVVFYSDRIDQHDIWPTGDYKKEVQKGNEIGSRMLSAFEYAFKHKYKKVVLLGGDIIEIRPDVLQRAFDLLERTTTVLGPAKDGGYYLIGMNRLIPDLFEGISWSTKSVFDQSVDIIVRNSLTWSATETLSDLDDYQDYIRHKEKIDKITI